MNKKIKLFVLCSVLLNALLIGTAIGHFYGRFTHNPEDQIAAILDKSKINFDKRKYLLNKVDQIRQGNIAKWEQIKKAREESLKILTAKTFDANAYRKVLSGLFGLRDQHHQRMTEVIVEIASELDQQDRIALAETLRRPPAPRFPAGRPNKLNDHNSQNNE